VKFFFDGCTSPYHAKGIRGFAELQDHEIVHLEERFPKDTLDVDWIRALAAEGGWIIVSADVRISRNPAERQAWQDSRLTAFFFASPWPNDNFWKQSTALMNWWPHITAQARRTPVGHGFLMPKKGTELRQIFP
jgi:hypothetical protein